MYQGVLTDESTTTHHIARDQVSQQVCTYEVSRSLQCLSWADAGGPARGWTGPARLGPARSINFSNVPVRPGPDQRPRIKPLKPEGCCTPNLSTYLRVADALTLPYTEYICMWLLVLPCPGAVSLVLYTLPKVGRSPCLFLPRRDQ